MRVLSGVLSIVLALFAVAQWNDPDPLVWVTIYGGAALWLGIAAFRPGLLARRGAVGALAASVAVALALTAWFWPSAGGWWQRDVWWEDEAAREGMGLMIVLGALLVVAIQALRVSRRRTRPAS